MADQNVTTTKDQRLEELRVQGLLPDSECLEAVSSYATAMSDALSSLDFSDLLSETPYQLMMIQHYLNMRVQELIKIQRQGDSA
ncbi:MAG: hypothetical protein VYA55_13030 [Pseudomonadota bacterium]|nr:hypothetical protein [Pseudomonadota bacterium]